MAAGRQAGRHLCCDKYMIAIHNEWEKNGVGRSFATSPSQPTQQIQNALQWTTTTPTRLPRYLMTMYWFTKVHPDTLHRYSWPLSLQAAQAKSAGAYLSANHSLQATSRNEPYAAVKQPRTG